VHNNGNDNSFNITLSKLITFQLFHFTTIEDSVTNLSQCLRIRWRFLIPQFREVPQNTTENSLKLIFVPQPLTSNYL